MSASGTASPRGAFFDSTIDRFTDALLFGGVAWHFSVAEDPRLSVLPFAVMALSSVISYMRAKAESLGLDAKGGLMERAERIIALCLGLLFPVLLFPALQRSLDRAQLAVHRMHRQPKLGVTAQLGLARRGARQPGTQAQHVAAGFGHQPRQALGLRVGDAFGHFADGHRFFLERDGGVLDVGVVDGADGGRIVRCGLADQ